MKIITVLAACLAAATPPLAAAGGRVLPWPDLLPPLPNAQPFQPQEACWQPAEPQQVEPQQREPANTRNLYQWPPSAPEGGWWPPVGMGMPAMGGAKTYRVTAGDTLYRVMRQTGMPIKKLASLNKLAGPPYQIRKGQVLRLE
ncbi:MAG: LysM domain-containing protein [Thiothrix sp.]|uniref:LysM peptidoglycan-binding domain-containing protein n=1 Tax=Thiothrix sp. TaxID=1032 RepID=UPI00260D1669|nr:LysM domain-containing protein [Thiothrix sp.]MDD5395340.1 LysM domain-containing protein [Thiothrix sp.]